MAASDCKVPTAHPQTDTPDRHPSDRWIEPATTMNDPTQTNDPNKTSPQDHADSIGHDPDPQTPHLFNMENLEAPIPTPQDSTSDTPDPTADPIPDPTGETPSPTPSTSEGLEELATRLPQDHPPKWAMNWKPTGEEEDQDIPGDHHPARHAGTSEEANQESNPEPIQATHISDEHDLEPPEQTPADLQDEVVTSMPPKRVPTPTQPTTTDSAPREGGGQLGWIAAAIVALAWIGVELGTNATEPAPAKAQAATDAPLQEAPLARPAPDPSRAILLEEIAVLQDEVAVLRGELGAANLLRDDHERITIELTRLERRRTVTLDQLLFLEASLERERQERAVLASELDHAQRFLDEARGTD